MRTASPIVVFVAAGLLAMTAAGQVAIAPASVLTPQEQALADARTKLRAKVLSTQVTPGVTVEQALRESGRLAELGQQLDTLQPQGGPRWIGDQGCQVRLEWTGQPVARLLQEAGRPADQLKRLQGTTYVSVGTSIVSNTIPTTSTETASSERTLIPQQPPAWVNRPIQAEAWVRSAGTPLVTAQAAERQASQTLRERMGALILSYRTSVDQAAKLDPAIAEAVDRAMQHARVSRTDYGPDGSATVRLELNLRHLWDEFNR